MTTSTVEARDEQRTRVALDLGHHLVLLLTIVLRPFVFGGDLAASDQLAWHTLVLVGWGLCLLELWSGRRLGLRWGWAGVAAAALLALLLPAAWQAEDPALGWGRWVSWASLLLWAGYLMQVLPGRVHFAWALLVATLAVEVVLVLVQQVHVLPAMGAAMTSGDDAMAELVARVGDADVANRIGHGGTYGSLTLANILAAWLLIAGLPLAGALGRGIAAWRRGVDGRPRSDALVLGCVLLAATVGALVTTGARGAPAAAVAAGALVALRWGRGGWRVLPAAVLGGGLLVALLVPALREPLQASIDVRLGYWRAAGLALREHWATGAGIGAFEWLAPLHLRSGDEFSRFAHNEVIEATLAGGVAAGLALLWWWWRLAWPRPQVGDDSEAPPVAGARVWHLRWLPVLVFPYMLIFGTFASDNLAWWPGGDGAAIALYAAGLGALLGWIAGVARCLPLPPAAWLQFALATGVFACLLDFQLHDLGFLGMLVLVACLAAGGGGRERPVGGPLRLGVSATVLVAAAALVFGALRAADLRAIDRTESLIDGYLRSAERAEAETTWAFLHDLALEAGLPPPDDDLPPPEHQAGILLAAWERAEDRLAAWPPSGDRLIGLAARHPDARQRLERLESAAERHPRRADVWAQLAGHALQLRAWDLALTSARRAVARYPAQLRYRALLVRALEAAAKRRRGDPAALRAEAERLRASIAHENPQAFPRHRVDEATLAPAARQAPSSGPPSAHSPAR